MKLILALYLLAASSTAHAHVTANPSTADFGSYLTTSLRVPHGCDGSSTTKIQVKIDSAISHVKSRRVPGWQLDIVFRDNDSATALTLGENKTVDTVTWTALTSGNYLADDMFEDFSLNVKLPQSSAKKVVYLRTVQTCENGSASWSGIPASDGTLATGVLPAPKITMSGTDSTTGTMHMPGMTGMNMAENSETSNAVSSNTMFGAFALLPSLLALAAAYAF